MSVKLFKLLVMINSLSIAPSPKRDRGSGPETRPGIEPPEVEIQSRTSLP
jgi:hypothetical protein